MSRLTELTPAEQKIIDDAIAETERVKGRKLNRPDRNILVAQVLEQIGTARYVAKMQPEREEAQEDAKFTWSKSRPFRR